MKSLISCLILFAYLPVFAQVSDNHSHNTKNVEQCATMMVYERMKQEDPDYENQMILHEKELQEWIKNNQSVINNSKEVITIPVVVHVVYRLASENISDAQIFSQIEVLNEDFRRMNTDASNTPSAFSGVAADCQIYFCLAQRTPTGGWTNGIERRQTSVTTFYVQNNNVKYYNNGGLNAWDRSKYFNIWVCKLESQVLGYAQFPGGNAATDGIVINYNNFGRVGNVSSPYHKGRSATHETGHWLSLYHIWGDDNGTCSGSDEVGDTPNQADYTQGCPTFPYTQKSKAFPYEPCNTTSDMFMNYMDYSYDACMNMFTNGQKARMIAVLNTSRASLKSSQMCQIVSANPEEHLNSVMVFPNPANDKIIVRAFADSRIETRVTVFDIGGRLIKEVELGLMNEIYTEIDVEELSAGIYFIEVRRGDFKVSRRLAISR